MQLQSENYMEAACGLRSFFVGGFECSSHRLQHGRRLDLLAATGHDRFCDADYARLQQLGISSARDGIRWHLIEERPYHYDFSSFLPMLRAARNNRMQVIWDLFHYGWPDDLEIFSSEFIQRFESFAREVAIVVSYETDDTPYFTPVNEISFVAWGAGDVGFLNPFARERGDELKRQLVRANIAAIEAVRSVAPQARFVQVDPIINVVTTPEMDEAQKEEARGYVRAQFDSWDISSGRRYPELGGDSQYLDIVGANYYVHNQWVHGGKFIEPGDPRYRPLHDILRELYQRYRRPLFIAETGIEDDLRPEWLRYVCDQAVEAMMRGIPVEGICLYPILNYPGWQDDRHCCTGLWGYCDDSGQREVFGPLAQELARQQTRIEQVRSSCCMA